jgi:hypothetical protein
VRSTTLPPLRMPRWPAYISTLASVFRAYCGKVESGFFRPKSHLRVSTGPAAGKMMGPPRGGHGSYAFSACLLPSIGYITEITGLFNLLCVAQGGSYCPFSRAGDFPKEGLRLCSARQRLRSQLPLWLGVHLQPSRTTSMKAQARPRSRGKVGQTNSLGGGTAKSKSAMPVAPMVSCRGIKTLPLRVVKPDGPTRNGPPSGRPISFIHLKG